MHVKESQEDFIVQEVPETPPEGEGRVSPFALEELALNIRDAMKSLPERTKVSPAGDPGGGLGAELLRPGRFPSERAF